MGSYTKFGFSFTVKLEYRKYIQDMLTVNRDSGNHRRWQYVIDCLDHPWYDDSPLLAPLREFALDDRHDWIGFAKLSNNARPYRWADVNYFSISSGHWIFTGSVKNYDDVIGKFIKLILPILSDSIDKIQIEPESSGGDRRIYDVESQNGNIKWAAIELELPKHFEAFGMSSRQYEEDNFIETNLAPYELFRRE